MHAFEVFVRWDERQDDCVIWKRVMMQVPDGHDFEVYCHGRIASGSRAGRDIYLRRQDLPERCVNFD